MNIGAEEVAFSGPGGSQSSEAENGICEYNYLLVSSTSWTEDEDFSILLDALVKFDVEMRKKTKSQVKILVIITGKGSLKEFYLGDIAKLSLVYVNIKTAWLTAEDYPLLLGMFLEILILTLSNTQVLLIWAFLSTHHRQAWIFP